MSKYQWPLPGESAVAAELMGSEVIAAIPGLKTYSLEGRRDAALAELMAGAGLPSGGINASSFRSTSNTAVAAINAAAAFALATGLKYVTIPLAYLPYDDTQLVCDPSITLVPEGEAYVPGTLDARAYGGLVNAGRAVAKALAQLPTAGGTVDARGFMGAQVVDGDIFGNVATERPMKVMFGPSTWSCQQGNSSFIMLLFGSNIEINLNESYFKLNDGQNQSDLIGSDPGFNGNNPGNGTIAVTNGSNSATLSVLARGVVPAINKPVAFLGHTPKGGQRDNTTLAAALTDTTGTTVQLASIAGQVASFLSTGYIKIDNEIISYPVSGISGNNLTGCTRGALGSTAATHLINAAVDRVVFDNYVIRAVTGTGPWTLTLDRNVTLAPTMTAATALIGPCDVSFTGTGGFDGNKPATDTPANGIAIQQWGGARLKVAPTISFRNWDHGGVILSQHQNAVIDGTYQNMGNPSVTLGFTVLFFQGCQGCTAYGDYENCNSGPATDDRTSTPQHYDNSDVGCVLLPRTIRNINRGVTLEGTSQSYAFVPRIDTWGTGASGWAFGLTNPQWVTAGAATGNIFDIGFVTPIGVIGTLSAGSSGNFVFIRQQGATVSNLGTITNVIVTLENATNPGPHFSGPIGVGTAPLNNVIAAFQERSALTQSIVEVLSPDGAVIALPARVFNNGGDASPVWMGASSSHGMALLTGGLKRWTVDTAGRLVPDPTNGGARQEVSVALVSGTTPALDASKGNYFTLNITSNIAVVIAVPANPPAAGLSQRIRIAMRNGSGGALTTPPTFNTGANGFKFSAVTNPANGTQVVYDFEWDPVQSFWYEVGTHQAAGL